MKFTCTIDIELPVSKVTQLFADPNNLKEYQEGFISKELLEGIEGQNGAISLLKYKQGKGVMKLTETIVDNSLPDYFIGHYHHTHMDNIMHCRFISLGENKTLYESEIEYTVFRGFLPKMMGFLFPSMFKNQVQKWLESFKLFAERQ